MNPELERIRDVLGKVLNILTSKFKNQISHYEILLSHHVDDENDRRAIINVLSTISTIEKKELQDEKKMSAIGRMLIKYQEQQIKLIDVLESALEEVEKAKSEPEFRKEVGLINRFFEELSKSLQEEIQRMEKAA